MENNDDFQEITKLIRNGSFSEAFQNLDKKISENPQLAEKAFTLIDQVLNAGNIAGNDLSWLHSSIGAIAGERPDLAEECLVRFKKGFALVKDPYQIDEDYDTVAPIAYKRPDLYKGLLELQHQVETHYKKIGGKVSVGKNVYRRIRPVLEQSPDLGEIYLADAAQKLSKDNMDYVDLNNATSEIDHIVGTAPKFATPALSLIEKAITFKKHDDVSLKGIYFTLECIYEADKKLGGQILQILGKALKSEKNDEDSLEEGREIYTTIQKENRLAKIEERKANLAEKKGENVSSAAPSAKQTLNASGLSKSDNHRDDGR